MNSKEVRLKVEEKRRDCRIKRVISHQHILTNYAFMVYLKLHQKCKVQVIVWHVHKIMMIPITRNHQEGEEHAKRSSVSSLVRWLFEGIVLTLEPKKY